MKRNLRPRLMTMILVVFLPISVSMLTLSATVLARVSQQSGERALHLLTLGLNQVERDAALVEYCADEFA